MRSIYYFYLTASGKFEGASAEQVKGAFGEMLGKPEVMILCMVAVVILGFFVNSIGLQNGLERITKGMMIALLLIMVVLAVRSVTLDGAKEGLFFYLVPSLENMKAVGIGNVIDPVPDFLFVQSICDNHLVYIFDGTDNLRTLCKRHDRFFVLVALYKLICVYSHDEIIASSLGIFDQIQMSDMEHIISSLCVTNYFSHLSLSLL